MSEHHDPDPCAELLRPGPLPERVRFREDLLRQTVHGVHRRRWAGRLVVAGALAACYAAGLGTAYLGTETIPTPPVKVTVQPAPREQTSVEAMISPEALEWQALDSEQPQPDAYRRAGDRYVTEEGDYGSALRCYRNSLDTGSESDRAIAPTDSWLLMALKTARQKEKQYANPDE